MSAIASPCIANGMETCCVDEDRIWHVWNWCSDAYLRNGQKLTLPAHTNPTNTYQWRYARAIAIKFNEWQFDDDTCKKFIEIAAQYAKKIGVLRKGLSVLHQSNMLEVCYQMLQEEKHNSRQSRDSLELMHTWVQRQIGTENPIAVMLRRTNPDAMCNLTLWYRAHKVSELYLAVSKNCCRTLAQLGKIDAEERALLPKPTKLYMLRAELVRDVETFRRTKQILGKDWRESHS